MNFINQLEDDSILIIPSNIKTKVLTYINDNKILKSIKILSFNDLKKGLFFDYDTSATKAVMDYLNVSYAVANLHINNLYYLDECNINDNKIKKLLDLKNYLDNNNYLIKDPLFIELLKSKSHIYVFGFDYITLFNKHLLNIASKYIDVNVIDTYYHEYSHTAYEFKNNFDEISFVFESILKLIDEGVSLDKIYIANYTNDDAFVFRTLTNLTGLPIYLGSTTTLYSTNIGSYFLKNLSNNMERLLYKIRTKFDIDENPENERVYTVLTNMLNSYYWCDGKYEDIKEIIEHDMQKRKIPSLHYDKEISLTNIIDNVFDDDEYVFLIGCNLGVIPKLKKDEDYIDDSIKPPYLETTNVYNETIKSTIIKAIKNIKNLTITYSLGTPFKTCEKSFLLNDESITIKKMDDFVSNYSNSLNILNLSKSIDNKIKFNTDDKNLSLLFSNYKTNYKTYSNEFKGIDLKTLKEKIDNNFVFSYSNIVEYYKCPFRFYTNRILKIENYETDLSQFIGSLFHYVLENCLEDTSKINEVFKEYVDAHFHEIDDTYKNKYFIESLRDEIKFLVDTIIEQQSHSKHTKTLYEHEIVIDVKRKINTKVKGFVDKILMLDNKVLIVDYKTTSSQSIDSDLFEFGLSTQLPIYLYLLESISDDIEVAGIYIQHILDLNQVYEPDKDLLEEKKKNLKLEGITFNNIDLISKFDDTYEKSQVIKSLSVTKDGSLKKSKSLMSIDERKELTDLMGNLIIKCIDNVSDGDFKINPIKIEKHADGCDYCPYKDICFRKFKDFNIQHIKTKRGDEDE